MDHKTKDEGAKPTIGGPMKETECCKDGACCWNNEGGTLDSKRPTENEWTDE